MFLSFIRERLGLILTVFVQSIPDDDDDDKFNCKWVVTW
jgi:hypothetical protein